MTRSSSHHPIGDLNLQRCAADRDALRRSAKVAARIEGLGRRGAGGAVVDCVEIAGKVLDALPSNRTLRAAHRVGDPSFDLHHWDTNDGTAPCLRLYRTA
jgi:hypothetical protein